MHSGETLMAAAWREAPDVVRRQTALLARPMAALATRLRDAPPRVMMTCARGSSACAANFGKHLIERDLGIPVATAAPSIMTVYHRRLRLDQQLFLAVSQSGLSDDLVESAASAKASGALTVAIVNDPDSPLAATCDIVLPMAAGPERSVAATKTFVAAVSILLGLVAAWTESWSLQAALKRLPDRLAAASDLDWREALGALSATSSLAILGRGPTLSVAQEAALKLKEVCNIHSEAFSASEFQHGPIALVSEGYPILVFLPEDAAATGLAELAADLVRKGGRLFVTGADVGGAKPLPVLAADHPDTDALCLIQSFYGLALHLAEARGLNADQPRHLQKVTRTR